MTRLILAVFAFAFACSNKHDAPPTPAVDIDAVGPQPDGTTVLASRQNMLDVIVADDHALYWTARGGMEHTSSKDHAGPRGVFRLTGNDRPARLADTGPAWVAQDATDLFLADADAKTITRVPKTSGPPEVLATGIDNISGIAVDDTWLYYLAGAVIDVTPASTTGGIPRANVDVAQGDAIWRVPKRGRADADRVVGGLGLATRLALDGDAFYFAQTFEGSIVRVAKRGGALQIVVRDTAIFPNWIVANAAVYYEHRGSDGGTLSRVVPGGQPEVLFRATSPPSGSIAVAGDTVYVATDDGAIQAVSPKATKLVAKRNLPPSSMVVRDNSLVIAEVFRVISIPLR